MAVQVEKQTGSRPDSPYFRDMPLRSLFVDFNSYFASVEQHVQPKLRGKPVAVVPVFADTTCCIAASYEAKRFGVKTCTMVGEAKKMFPGLQVIEARPALYVEYHNELVALVESCMHVSQVHSIDEMDCELTGKWRQKDEAMALARQIKQRLAEEYGPAIRCSIGIAPNMFLAKTASDMQKPDGLVLIEEKDLPHSLHRLELRDLCGIGANMERRLNEKGFFTVKALCAASKKALLAAWGSVEGERMYELLRGRVLPERMVEHRSVSHSHVLPPEERNDADALAVLNRLLQKAAVRLRKMEYLAGGLSLTVKYCGGTRWCDEIHITETDDSLELLRLLELLWRRKERSRESPMAVGVVLFHLVHRGNYTPSLFEKVANRKSSLNKAVDTLNEKFGKNTVYFGGAHDALGSAPMRIAFNRIPDLETESDDDSPPTPEAGGVRRKRTGSRMWGK